MAFYHNAAIPDNFSPVDQQVQFFDFVSPTMAIQLRDKLDKRADATWKQCVEEVEALMEIKYSRVWRCLEAFTITPSELEYEYSRFIVRQKALWAQAKVSDMTIEEIKIVHLFE